MGRVFVLWIDIDFLLFVRPAVQLRAQLVGARRQLQLQRGFATRFPVDRNFGAARLARHFYRRAHESERLGRLSSARDFHIFMHFPIAATHDD